MFTTASGCAMQTEGQLHRTIVKNTFIEVCKTCDSIARRVSLPASLDLCSEHCAQMDMKRVNSEASTALPFTPTSSLDSDEVMSSPSERSGVYAPPTHVTSSRRPPLSPKLLQYKARTDKIIKRVAKILEASENIAKIDIANGAIVVQVCNQGESLTQQVVSLAQKTLLEVTAESKCIYTMGFATSGAFKMHERGFEVTLGAMENAAKACWHVYKKGFCRHGASCSKQHPVFQMPLQVIIEAPANGTN